MTALEEPPMERPEKFKGNLVAELRWQAEVARLLVDPVWRGAGVPRGDGETVLVVPGVMSGDRSTLLLRKWLRQIGYQPHSAGMELNIDCSARALDKLERRVERLVA